MDVERWLKVKDIVAGAIELSGSERHDYVVAQCRDDFALRTEVFSFLGAESRTIEPLAENLPKVSLAEPAQMGRSIGAYRLDRCIGHGGMGEVYLGIRDDGEVAMQTAIKLVRENHSAVALKRFKRERDLLARLKHPYIGQLLDAGTTEDGFPYFIMEYIDGTTLDAFVAQNEVSFLQSMELMAKIISALGYAHAKGVVHRDIKPGNIMVTVEGEPKLLDFGIARMFVQQEHTATTGRYLMTPEYAAPEQLRGAGASPAGDVYALGLVFLEMLTGRRPRDLDGDPGHAVAGLFGVEQERFGDVENLSGLIQILQTALSVNPEDRYAQASHFGDALREYRHLGNQSLPLSIHSRDIDVFIWHAGEQAESIMKLAHYLEDVEGLRIWLDIWHVPLGSDLAQERRDALMRSKAVLVCVCDDGKPWIDEELAIGVARQVANNSLRLVPLLLVSGERSLRDSELPRFMRRRVWATYPDTFTEENMMPLVRGLRGLPPGRDTFDQHTGTCPFRGLAVFREEDRRFFFGREVITQRLFDDISKHSFLAVLGPSGSGKSSTVQAGLMPLLREEEHFVCLMSPGSEPLDALSGVLSREMYGDNQYREKLRHRMLASPKALHYLILEMIGESDSDLILVIDQLEELFTMSQMEGEVTAFLDNLTFALEQTVCRLRVVVTLRSDFVGQCVAYPDLNTLVCENTIQVEPMSQEELHRAVKQPARLAGLSFEAGLLERIIGDVSGASGELPLLGHALLELYQRRRGVILTNEAYEEIGGIEGALARRAELEYDALEEDSKALLRKMFTIYLVHPGDGSEDTRRRARRDELINVGNHLGSARELIARLVNARLLTAWRDPDLDFEMVEVAHEALIRKWGRIRTWMDEDRETSRQMQHLRRLARVWDEAGRDQDHLPRGRQLARVEILCEAETDHLGELEKSFLEEALALREAHRIQERKLEEEERAEQGRRQRTIIAVLAAFFFVVLTAVISLFFQMGEVQKAHGESLEITRFLSGLLEDFEPSMMGGRDTSVDRVLEMGEARLEELNDKPLVKASLMHTLARSYRKLGAFDKARPLLEQALGIWKKEVSSDDMRLVETLSELGTVLVYEGDYYRAEDYLGHSLDIRQRRFSENHPELATGYHDLGNAIFGQGAMDEAEPLFRKALEIRLNVLGRNHADTAEAYISLALLCYIRGYYNESLMHHREALDIYLKVHGPDHTLVAEARAELAWMLSDTFRLEEAEDQLLEALDVRQRLLGEAHPDTASSYVRLAELRRKQARHDEAVKLFRDALAILENLEQENILYFMEVKSTLAGALFELGRLDEASELWHESYSMMRDMVGPDHISLGISKSNYALSKLHAGKLEESLSALEEAVGILSKHYQPGNYQLFHLHVQLAENRYFLGDVNGAEAILNDLLPTLDDCESCDNFDRKMATGLLGAIWSRQGCFEMAEPLILESMCAIEPFREELIGWPSIGHHIVSHFQLKGDQKNVDFWTEIFR